ncbi:MAG: 50S ribosomal protein L11 methyltransferase [Clostridia bacterium]
MPWLALTLRLGPEGDDGLGDALLESGACSVSVDGLDGADPSLQALFPLDADAAGALARAAASLGRAAPPAQLGRVDDEDWVRRTQSQFQPLQVGERLWVGPTWHEPPAGMAAVVRLDPGLAFGTGSHPSTRLVLAFLEAAIRGGESLLDYGCGSGILAIAAAKLGAARVDGVDIDPEALQTAAANAQANGVRLQLALPEETLRAEYDIVVANILAQPLIVLAPLLAAHTAKGGRIALSGILSAQAAEVAAAYEPFFACETSRTLDGWALVEGRRR